MIKKINSENIGRSSTGWLNSLHHFSFSSYYNPANMQFGVLRVVNDDLVDPQMGFGTHPHQNMEIISYVVDGELTHKDSMGNESTLERGQVQYMSAGTGVYHSEYNQGDEELRFLQIWILPDKAGHTPNYGEVKFEFENRRDRWMPIATGSSNRAFPISIHADVNMYSTYLTAGKSLPFEVAEGRQAYLVAIEGDMKVNGIDMHTRDAMEIVEEDIVLEAGTDSHVLIIELKKD